jgi:hypothetical protein
MMNIEKTRNFRAALVSSTKAAAFIACQPRAGFTRLKAYKWVEIVDSRAISRQIIDCWIVGRRAVADRVAKYHLAIYPPAGGANEGTYKEDYPTASH